MLKEFRDFLMRGNLVELAVAVIIATALTVLIKSLIDNLVMPVLAAFGGTPDFRDLTFTINDSVFRYGAFLTDALTFVVVLAVIFFFIVKPVTAMTKRFSTADDEDEPDAQEELLREIRGLLEQQNELLRR